MIAGLAILTPLGFLAGPGPIGGDVYSIPASSRNPNVPVGNIVIGTPMLDGDATLRGPVVALAHALRDGFSPRWDRVFKRVR